MESDSRTPMAKRAHALSAPEPLARNQSLKSDCQNPGHCDVRDESLAETHVSPTIEDPSVDTDTESPLPESPVTELEGPDSSAHITPGGFLQLSHVGAHIPMSGDGPDACCPFETAFACISLHRTDRLRMLQFPAEDIISVRELINHFWPSKLHSEREYAAAYEFRFHGHPWNAQGKESVASRIIIREIFAYLYSVGWLLHVTTDVSKKDNDKDTLVFRNQGKPPPPADWLSISFNQRNRLRLIGADEDLILAFKLLMKNMRLWDKDKWEEEHNNAFEIRLHDHPWWPVDEDTVTMRALLLKMFETLEHHGWTVYSSLDQSNGHGPASRESDSWYCMRLQKWQPGNFVHHR